MIRNIGRLKIGLNAIEDKREEVLKVFQGVIVLEASNHFYDLSIEYLAICDKFREINKGEKVPCYNVKITELGDGEKEVVFEEVRA